MESRRNPQMLGRAEFRWRRQHTSKMRGCSTGLRKSKDISVMGRPVGTEAGRWPARNACHQWALEVPLGMVAVSPGQFQCTPADPTSSIVPHFILKVCFFSLFHPSMKGKILKPIEEIMGKTFHDIERSKDFLIGIQTVTTLKDFI